MGAVGIEPTTSALSRQRSTAELRAHRASRERYTTPRVPARPAPAGHLGALVRMPTCAIR